MMDGQGSPSLHPGIVFANNGRQRAELVTQSLGSPVHPRVPCGLCCFAKP